MSDQKQTTNLPGADASKPGYIYIDSPKETPVPGGGYIDVFGELGVTAPEPEIQLPDLPEPVAEVLPIDDTPAGDPIDQIKAVGAPETLSATPLGLEIGDELVLKTGTPGEGKNERLVGKQKLLFEEYNRDTDKVSVDADGERLEFPRAEFGNLFQLLPEPISAGPAETEEGSLKSYSFDLGGGTAEAKEPSTIAGAANSIENEANTHLDIEVGQQWQDPDLGGMYIEKIKAADGKGILGIKFKNTDEIREATAAWTPFFEQMSLGSETSAPENGTGNNITREVEDKIDDLSLKINHKIILDGAAETYESGQKVRAEAAVPVPTVETQPAEAVVPTEEAAAEEEVAQVVEEVVPEVVVEEKRENASDQDTVVVAPDQKVADVDQTETDRHRAFAADTKRPANSMDAAALEEVALAPEGADVGVEASGSSGQA